MNLLLKDLLVIPVDSSEVKFLSTPEEFYNTLIVSFDSGVITLIESYFRNA